MPSLLPDFEYDIFISYRQNDNKVDGWVTAFVEALRAELDATLKNPVSIYFDENPHDGLLETHQVNASLDRKLRCIVFIPIVSQTYCDTGSYAWQHEFLKFIELASSDSLGIHVKLANGNVTSRVLPVQIHELDTEDRAAIESALGGPLRAIPFIYSSPGVNRPLLPHEEHPENNKNKSTYRDQINKVANALKEIGSAVQHSKKTGSNAHTVSGSPPSASGRRNWSRVISAALLLVVLALVIRHYYNKFTGGELAASKSSVAVIPFRNGTGDPGMSHYGVGIASEVSTKLGLTKQFDFISSLQATVKYQESEQSPAEIGKELGVTHILTGLYQTAGDNMQVLVELLDLNGKVIWSITYKTKYQDMFVVQATIARQVLDKFAVKTSPEQDISAPNLEAYAHAIKGLEIVLKSNLPEDRMKAIPEYQAAIDIDSSFIEPWWGIIEEYCYFYWNRGTNQELTLEMIQPYMEYVQNNFPDSWKKKAVMGTYEYWALAHYQKALDLFLEVLEEAPQDAGVHSMVAAIYRRQLRLGDAMDNLTVSLKQTPSGVIFWNELLAITELNGDYDNAIKAAGTIAQLNPKIFGNLYRLRRWTGTMDQLPQYVKKTRGHGYVIDSMFSKRDAKAVLTYVDQAPDSVFQPPVRLYHQIVANYLLKRDDQVKKLCNAYLKMEDRSIERRATALALLRKEKDYNELFVFAGRSPDEDLYEQWDDDAEKVTYEVLAGNYAKADQRLKEVNQKYPQVGAYGWLNLPIYDRIKQEYPAFQTTINELKLPPKIMDTKLIKM